MQIAAAGTLFPDGHELAKPSCRQSWIFSSVPSQLTAGNQYSPVDAAPNSSKCAPAITTKGNRQHGCRVTRPCDLRVPPHYLNFVRVGTFSCLTAKKVEINFKMSLPFKQSRQCTRKLLSFFPQMLAPDIIQGEWLISLLLVWMSLYLTIL